LRIDWKAEDVEVEVDGIAEVWDMVVIFICWEGVELMGSQDDWQIWAFNVQHVSERSYDLVNNAT